MVFHDYLQVYTNTKKLIINIICELHFYIANVQLLVIKVLSFALGNRRNFVLLIHNYSNFNNLHYLLSVVTQGKCFDTNAKILFWNI